MCSQEWVITPRGWHSGLKNWLLENWYQTYDLSLLDIVNKNLVKKENSMQFWYVWLLIPTHDSWLQDSGFRQSAVNHSLFTRQFINRPGVARAVLQSASWSIHSFTEWVSDPFPPNLQNIINHKPEELGSWNFERMFTPTTCHMSHVTCHVSHITCHTSRVRCHMSHFLLLLIKWWSLSVEGLLSTGPTPSSSLIHKITKQS